MQERTRNRRLDRQAFAAFGPSCVDHGAATTGFHANENAMGAGTTDFRWLVSAFHLEFLTGSIPIRRHKKRQRSVKSPRTSSG